MKRMRKDRTIRLLNTTFRAIELIPNLLFIALYILAVLSPFISPLKTQIPAFLNLAYPLLLAGLLLLWLFYLLRRKCSEAFSMTRLNRKPILSRKE